MDRWKWNVLRVLSLCGLVQLGSACSYIFVDSPPKHPESVPPEAPIDCTSGKAAPIIDTIIGGYQVVRTGYALSADDDVYRNQELSREADIALGVGLTTLFVASAVYGYSNTAKCTDAKAAQDRRYWREKKRKEREAKRAERERETNATPGKVPADSGTPDRYEPSEEDLERWGGPDDEGVNESERLKEDLEHEPDDEVRDDQEPSKEDLERWGGPDDDEVLDDQRPR